MEVYDTANKLAEEIRKSDQYVTFKNIKERLFNDPQMKNKIMEFENLKQELQLMEVKQQNKEEIDENDKKVKLIKLYNGLVEDKDIKAFFDAEIAFNQMMIDLNKIIGDSIKDVLFNGQKFWRYK